jgi:polyvinyl alcohol dehydrogenase (cytochrome)
MRGIVGGLLAVALVAAACSGDDAAGPGPVEGATTPIDGCDWPMWGYSPERTFATACDTGLNPGTVGELERAWFHQTDDVVTSTPAVVGDTVYVGDWAGVVYALDRETGDERWRVQTPEHQSVYAGQIVSSPAVADLDGERWVFIGSGKTMFALSAADGEERWHHELGELGDTVEPTEFESSPVVVGDVVLAGYDVHNTPGYRSGLIAFDATSGDVLWDFDPDEAGGFEEGTGCVDVWASPSVDEGRGLVFAGTGNCPSSPEGWGDYTEAIFALDLETGEPVWSYQPHEPNNDDLDFAGAPNLFSIGDRDVVGLGNKDGHYYVVDRATGAPVWQVEATQPGLEEPGSNFSTGGFIGGTAVSDGMVVGGTGVGPCPCAHGIDAATGEIAWQNEEPANTYAAASVADGVLFLGGNDFTFRAMDLATGEILWSEEMQGAVSGGSAISGDDVFAVAGIREPGLDERSESSGVYRFSLAGDEGPSSTTTTATTAPTGPQVTAFQARGLACTDQPCVVDFGINDPPPGTNPAVTVQLTADPLAIEVVGTDMGAPEDWVRAGSAAARAGATRFGVFLSARDDDPFGGGGLVCSWAEGEDGCTGTAIPRFAPSYNRLSVLAIVDESTEPTLSDGADRLVRTLSFDPALQAVRP